MQPPPTPSTPGEPLYEAFFGLKEQPFALTSDPRFLFMGRGHRHAYEELVTGLRRREGLLVLTGETGVGKTTLCRAVIEALGSRTFSAFIQNPYMSDAEVVRVILRDFGLVSRDEIRKGAFAKADMPQLLDTLEQFLQSLIPLNSYAVVVIDEAQSLPARVLDQIRQLGSFEQDGQRLLQIVLSGQPGLTATLRSEAMEAVDGRISRRVLLEPLSPKDVKDYIQHRLSVAGAAENVVFAVASAKAVSDLANGIPRRINLLCDRALEEGRIAGMSLISPAMVHRAARAVDGENAHPQLALDDEPETARSPTVAGSGTSIDRGLTFGYGPDQAPEPRRSRWIVALVAAILVAAVAYFGWSAVKSSLAPPALPVVPPGQTVRVPMPRPLPTDDDVRYVMQEIEKAGRGR